MAILRKLNSIEPKIGERCFLAENAAIAVMYSGDATELLDADEKFEYVKPKEGTNLWFDSMVILKNSKNFLNKI